jgi:hypothetical protein
MPANPLYPRDREMAGLRWSTELFNKKIDTTPGAGECWHWLGSTGPQGPLFGVRKVQPDGTDIARMTQARRILFSEYTGTALQPLQSVYHSCGNSGCMNPTHLTLQRPPVAPALTERPATGFKRTGRPRGRPPGTKTKTQPRARAGAAN